MTYQVGDFIVMPEQRFWLSRFAMWLFDKETTYPQTWRVMRVDEYLVEIRKV